MNESGLLLPSKHLELPDGTRLEIKPEPDVKLSRQLRRNAARQVCQQLLSGSPAPRRQRRAAARQQAAQLAKEVR